MMLVLAIIFLMVGFSAAVLVFIKRPKIEFQTPEEYEQLEKDVAEWLRT